MLKFSLIINFICISLTLYSQNIDRSKLSEDGYIEMFITLHDVNNNQPVADKNIRLENRNTGTKQNTRTDKDGRAILIEKTGCEYDVYVGKSRTAQSFGLEKMDFKRIQVPLGYDATEENEAIPQDNEVLLILRILDFKAKTQANVDFVLQDPKTGNIFTLKSDANGIAQTIVPSGAMLKVAFDKATHYTNIAVPNKSHHTYSYDLIFPDAEERAKWQLFPSPNMALFNFEFRDMQGELVANELFEVGGGNLTEKSEFVRTNNNGFAQILVPAQGSRAISHNRNSNFRTVNTDPKSANDIQVYHILYSSISEAQRKAYDDYLLELEAFRDSSNAAAEAERRAFEARIAAELQHADSLEKAAIIARAAAQLAKTEPEPITEIPVIETPIIETPKTTTPSAVITTTHPSVVSKKSKGSSSVSIDLNRISNPEHLKRTAQHYIQIMGKDPKFFEREGLTVLAVLQRMDTVWTNKIILTDVTGSMMPYMNQVLIWHALKNAQNETDAYLFFNDGNDRKTHEKMIGATGGFYNIRSQKMEDVYHTMITASLAGSGGDNPENDIEALLYAQKYIHNLNDNDLDFTRGNISRSELILVADALSPIRDISLIFKVNKPVRIILCGSQSNNNISINSDYLTLAAATGGSIHTIEADIMNISVAKENDIITVYGRQYVRKNGAFIPVLAK